MTDKTTAALKLAEQESCKECGAKQAQIDRLMLEYCPDEMTPEQMREWEKNIKPFVEPIKQEPNLYAAPVSAKREWVDLTVSDLDAIIEKHYDDEMDLKAMILDGIAALKEKNK